MLSVFKMPRISGLTIIEMFITLAVLTIMLALGTPAVARWLHQSEIRSSAESLRSALQKARTEAITRNTRIKITLGDSAGNARWSLGCVRVSTLCAVSLHEQRASSDSQIRWGATTSAGAGNLSVALSSGEALPGSVDFFPLGDARGIASGSDLARIDVMHVGDATAGRIVVRIDSAGNVRICDPALLATDIRGCR